MKPNFIFHFPKNEERIQIRNWFLRTEWLEYSLLLKHAPMQSSNLVTIHRIAGFQRAEYSQIMTQKTVPHVLIPCSYTTLCVHLQTTPIDSKDMKKTVRIPAMEIQYRCLQESWILFCYCHQQNHQLRFGSESLWIWPRRRKNPPSRADPRQAIAGVAKGRVESRKHSWSKHISFSRWEKNKYQNPQMILFQFEVWNLVC